ncbi:HlyD family efflux transporter periplasmic adaptor subunit [Brevibacillus laterosporus]|nr:HlyD family efflux transporter periplasmic adaptor subunit [Brevibacillus laterosporus]TPG91651.1 HlyD family efflux transporter periplasmic adaptor subunit [Brevibacillus laterosporus]
MRKRIGYVLLCVGLGFSLTACSANKEEQVMSGMLEAEELPIIAEVSGSILSISVAEGATIQKGQILAQIDPRSYELAVLEAEAVVQQATAKLDEAKAGNRSQTVKKGASTVASADANLFLAETRSRQATTNVARVEEQVKQVEQQLSGAKDTLTFEQRRLQESEALFNKGAITKREYDVQKEVANKAKTQVEQLNTQVAMAKTQIATAVEDQAAARAQIATAQAQREGAYADLDLLQEGTTNYTLRNLFAIEKQAKTKLASTQLQREKTKLVAPADGIILRKNVTEGEVAKTGASLFTMMKQNQLKVKVFIPEAEIGKVKVTDQVAIKVDAYPDETFAGRIHTISEKAEFTPRNVQTKNERTKLVFAVTIYAEEGLDRLKPGMPADVLMASVSKEVKKP